GKVVETGTHSELMARGGEYASLQRAQQQSQQSGEVSAQALDDEPESVPAPYVAPPVAELQLSWAADNDSLSIEAPGAAPLRVSARRCFPLTDPEHYLSLVDARGHEVCCLESSLELPLESQRALRTALAATELLPHVQRIEAVREQATQSSWQVVTDRGARDFVVEQEDHIRRLADGRHLITDQHGMRYLVPRPEDLDAKSRKLLSSFS
ncbi:MAG TPA: DUF1854 domain-containing protein, partial [Steroidobacteraceae bacterium]|nr:DUF1854 domain-containing protein [Steroidobacteraceae bacterium]